MIELTPNLHIIQNRGFIKKKYATTAYMRNIHE